MRPKRQQKGMCSNLSRQRRPLMSKLRKPVRRPAQMQQSLSPCLNQRQLLRRPSTASVPSSHWPGNPQENPRARASWVSRSLLSSKSMPVASSSSQPLLQPGATSNGPSTGPAQARARQQAEAALEPRQEPAINKNSKESTQTTEAHEASRQSPELEIASVHQAVEAVQVSFPYLPPYACPCLSLHKGHTRCLITWLMQGYTSSHAKRILMSDCFCPL